MTLLSDGAPSDGTVAEPAERVDDASVPGGAAPAQRRRPLVVALVLLLVLDAAALAGFTAARLGLRSTEEATARQAETLAGLQQELQAVTTTLQQLRADLIRRGDEVGRLTGSAEVRTIEIQTLTGQVQLMTTKVADLQQRISQNESIDEAQVQSLVILTECLDGIHQASIALAGGSSQATVAALEAVASTCQSALAIVEPGAKADFAFDFPDPAVIFANGQYYAFATNAAVGKVQVITSKDLDHWSWVGEALPRLPDWAVPGWTWAPTVLPRPDGYYLYYSARRAADARECISVAKSNTPQGPYVDLHPGPIVCPLEQGGAIDPNVLIQSDGTPYLYWKTENDTRGGNARLWAAKLAPELDRLDSEPALILVADRAWEDRTIEGPSMIEADGRFYLFYSGHHYDTAKYSQGYAVCETPTGPCRKPADNVIIAAHDSVAGPGGGEVFQAPGGQWFIAYHAWTAPHVGYPNRRRLYVDKLNIVDGRPVVTPR